MVGNYVLLYNPFANRSPMTLTPGTRVGPYEVSAAIGAGGMGEVYRARDTRLNRDVAIKVLPDVFSSDPDRLGRFRREAQLLATLNHQNIAAIYGLEEAGIPPGTSALVLELVDGPTLADRIAAGPLPLEEALSIARQLVDALESAHELGIVHRDLKPSNVKVRTDGTVKVLDFGLAKALGGTGPGSPAGIGIDRPDLVASPTITSPALMTGAGLILGTAAYMAPEQAKGRVVDRRADIWAFACVLYEMLTGRRAFEGDDVSETLAFVLTREPAWGSLPADIPPAVQRLLRRCLQKNPSRRLRDISDARLDIDDALASPSGEDATGQAIARSAPAGPRLAWRALPWAMAGVAGVAATVAVVGWAPWREAPLAPEVRFEFPAAGTAAFMSISPDGRLVAYSAPQSTSGQTMIWIRPLDSLEARPLPGTEGAAIPDWSPDSRFIVFAAEQRLVKMEVTGRGAPQTLTSLPPGSTYQRAAWNHDGVIVFSNAGSLHRVAETGGPASELTEPDPSREETFHATPWFLPDGRHFLYSAWSANPEHRAIYVGSLDSATRVRLMPSEGKVMYTEPGFLVFMRSGMLMAQPFDADDLTFTGEAVPLADNVAYTGTTGAAAFHISATGTLVYRRAGEGVALSRELVWVDREGQRGKPLGPSMNANAIELSPDGRRVAGFEAFGSGSTTDIWVLDLDRAVRTRLTTNSAADNFPVWSPDSTEVVFHSNRVGRSALFRKPVNGAIAELQLLQMERGIIVRPRGWSRDGMYLLTERVTGGTVATQRDLIAFSLSGEQREVKEVPYIATPFDEGQATLAPNGRWVAYVSNEPGPYQVFVQPFPDPTGGKWQISITGGQYPRWRGDGRELYYVRTDGRLIAVSVTTEGAFEAGRETPLFQVPFPAASGVAVSIPYDVSKDGSRFLLSAQLTPRAADTVSNSSPITVVLNWPSRLRTPRVGRP